MNRQKLKGIESLTFPNALQEHGPLITLDPNTRTVESFVEAVRGTVTQHTLTRGRSIAALGLGLGMKGTRLTESAPD
jgi:hypothetical protein